jgi:hypothetical protein
MEATAGGVGANGVEDGPNDAVCGLDRLGVEDERGGNGSNSSGVKGLDEFEAETASYVRWKCSKRRFRIASNLLTIS